MLFRSADGTHRRGLYRSIRTCGATRAVHARNRSRAVYTPLQSKSEWGTEKGSMILTTATTSKSEEVHYRLRMWIKQDTILAPTSQSYTVRVNVKGGVVAE